MLRRRIKTGKRHVQSFYTQRTLRIHFPDVYKSSLVMWCCSIWKQCSCSLGLLCLCPPYLILDFILVFLSPSCSGTHIRCSSHNITPLDVNSSHLVIYIYLNKEDLLVITLYFFLPSLFTLPPWDGWSCLMVFGVGGFSSGWCSLAGWCITDSRRSLVSSPTYPSWLARHTWISLRSITSIFDNSRYSWKTCGQQRGDGYIFPLNNFDTT